MISRRGLLLGTASVAALAAGSGADAAGFLFLANNGIATVPATGVVLNVGNGQVGGGLSFVNHLLVQFSPVFGQAQDSNNKSVVDYLDQNGFPVGTFPTGQSLGFTFTMESGYSGSWILDWVGNLGDGSTAAFKLNGGAVTVSATSGGAVVNSTAANLQVSGSSGSVTFTFNSPPTSATTTFLSGVAFSGLTSLRLYRTDEASQLPNIFRSVLVNDLLAIRPGALRFMDYRSINTNPGAQFNHRPPLGALTYASPFWLGGQAGSVSTWAGGDTTNTNTYAVSAPASWTGLVEGACIQCFIKNANTSTAVTLNVGGGGAVTVVGNNGNAMGVGLIPANSIALFIYSAIFGKWCYMNIGSGSQNTMLGFVGQIPIEAMVSLCNQVNADMWLPMPTHYTMAAVAADVAYVRDNLNSNLSLYVEYSNETWNGGFVQFNYCNNVATARGYGQQKSAIGYLICQVMSQAYTTWTTTRSPLKLRRVNAFQAFGPVAVTDTYQFQGNELGSSGNNVAPNRPIDLSDVLSYAHYYDGSQTWNFDTNYQLDMSNLLAAADDYASGDPTRVQNALNFLDADVRGQPANGYPGTRNGVAGQETLFTYTNGTPSTPIVTTGTGFIDDGSGGGSPSGIAGTVLTITALTSTYAAFQAGVATGLGRTITGSGVTVGTQIISQSSGTPGGVGTYVVNNSQTTSSVTMTQSVTQPANTAIYSTWSAYAVTYGKRVVAYEGGFELNAIGVTRGAQLGIAAAYCGSTGKIQNLITAYKNDNRFKQLVLDQMSQYMATAQSLRPAWYSLGPGPFQWTIYPGNVGVTPYYKSYDALVAYDKTA